MEAEAVRLEKSERKKNAFLGRIRYWLLSHKVPSVGSNAKIYLQLILTFFDAVMFMLIIVIFNFAYIIVHLVNTIFTIANFVFMLPLPA